MTAAVAERSGFKESDGSGRAQQRQQRQVDEAGSFGRSRRRQLQPNAATKALCSERTQQQRLPAGAAARAYGSGRKAFLIVVPQKNWTGQRQAVNKMHASLGLSKGTVKEVQCT